MKYMPERLKAARKYAFLTQGKVAAELGLPRTAIAMMEAGKRKVSADDLKALSKIYNRSQSWLRGDREKADDSGYDEFHHLAESNALTKEHQKAVNDARELFNLAAELRGIIDLDKQVVYPPSYDLPAPSTPADAIAQGEYYAEIERRRLGFGDAPVYNVVDFLMDQNIWFSMVDLPEAVSGIFVNDKETGLAIITNSVRKEVFRNSEQVTLDKNWLHYSAQRLTAAHEYAQTLFDRDRKMYVSSKTNKDELTEQRAEGFAIAFLLPKLGVEEELRRIGKGIPARKRHVSIKTAENEADQFRAILNSVSPGETGEPGETYQAFLDRHAMSQSQMRLKADEWFKSMISKGMSIGQYLTFLEDQDKSNSQIELQAESRRTSHSLEIGLHDVMFVANRFGVSYRDAIIRLVNLGYLTEQQSNKLLDVNKESRASEYSEMIRNPERGQGPDMGSLAKSRLLKTMANFAIEAYRIGKISESKLRDYARKIDKDADNLTKIAKCVADRE